MNIHIKTLAKLSHNSNSDVARGRLANPSNNALQAMQDTSNINLPYLTFMKLITLLCQTGTQQSLERGNANKSLLVCLSVTQCVQNTFSSCFLYRVERWIIKGMCHCTQLHLIESSIHCSALTDQYILPSCQ